MSRYPRLGSESMPCVNAINPVSMQCVNAMCHCNVSMQQRVNATPTRRQSTTTTQCKCNGKQAQVQLLRYEPSNLRNQCNGSVCNVGGRLINSRSRHSIWDGLRGGWVWGVVIEGDRRRLRRRRRHRFRAGRGAVGCERVARCGRCGREQDE